MKVAATQYLPSMGRDKHMFLLKTVKIVILFLSPIGGIAQGSQSETLGRYLEFLQAGTAVVDDITPRAKYLNAIWLSKTPVSKPQPGDGDLWATFERKYRLLSMSNVSIPRQKEIQDLCDTQFRRANTLLITISRMEEELAKLVPDSLLVSNMGLACEQAIFAFRETSSELSELIARLHPSYNMLLDLPDRLLYESERITTAAYENDEENFRIHTIRLLKLVENRNGFAALRSNLLQKIGQEALTNFDKLLEQARALLALSTEKTPGNDRVAVFNKEALSRYNHYTTGVNYYHKLLLKLLQPQLLERPAIPAQFDWEDRPYKERPTVSDTLQNEVEAAGKHVILLLDLSSSIEMYKNLDLIKASLDHTLSLLDKEDKITIMTFAGEIYLASRFVSPGSINKQAFKDRLKAGGVTRFIDACRLAYQLGETYQNKAATQRIIIVSDGNFEVPSTLIKLAQKQAKALPIFVLWLPIPDEYVPNLSLLAEEGGGELYAVSTTTVEKILARILAD